jgi:hypothetical protein
MTNSEAIRRNISFEFGLILKEMSAFLAAAPSMARGRMQTFAYPVRVCKMLHIGPVPAPCVPRPLRRKNTPATLGNLRNPELSFSASALLTGVSGRYRGTTRAAGSCKEGLGS